MSYKLMLQGTMSNVGKTLLTAGLCRIFRQDGFKVMPFKAQNMSLNSCITEKGEEMSRAQVMQAEAAGVTPAADMNPLLLKPTGLTGSQVILQGKVLENMTAREFYRRKKEFREPVLESFHRLEKRADILLIEGAGSPVELNLRKDDLVNMGFAEMVDAPVLLVGDIDPGGVFAQLLGTLSLLSKEERARVKGLIVNKFRGDRTLFEEGVRILEEKSGLSVVGVVPLTELKLPDEDSMSDRLKQKDKDGACFDLAVIRYPRISNFTDMDVFDAWPDMQIRYVTAPAELGNPDLLILPGSKNTLADLAWIRETGLDKPIRAYAAYGPVLGICGGFQMLGETVHDPGGVEWSHRSEEGTGRNFAAAKSGSSTSEAPGLGLLPIRTVMLPDKVQVKKEDRIGKLKGPLSLLSDLPVSGYEIHMGRTESSDPAGSTEEHGAGILLETGNVYGTYLHGFFDGPEVIPALRKSLAQRRGITLPEEDKVEYQEFKEREYDRLAEVLRQSLAMDRIYSIMGIARGDL